MPDSSIVTIVVVLTPSLYFAARLFLAQNDLRGMIPAAIGALTNLVQLNLEQQKLFGTIPTELSLLTNLGE